MENSTTLVRSLKPTDIASTSRAPFINEETLTPTPKEHFLRSDSVPKLEDLIAGDSRLEELLKGDPEPSKQEHKQEEDDDEEEAGQIIEVIPQFTCGQPNHSLNFLPNSPYPSGAFLCNVCIESGTGHVYHCAICNFDLCPSCASSGTNSSSSDPLPARNTRSSSSTPLIGCGRPYHSLDFRTSSPYGGAYMCNLCRKRGEDQVFHCTMCGDFDLHPDCAEVKTEIKSFAHPHGLILQPPYTRGYNSICDGCLKCLGDSQWVYRCGSGCDYDLHALCAKLAQKILHPIHADHELVLKNGSVAGPHAYVMCDGCDYAVNANELIYHCEECGFDLHPLCAIIPDVIRS